VPLKATNPVFRAKTERFREALRLLHASTTGSAQRMVKAVAKASGLTLIHPALVVGHGAPGWGAIDMAGSLTRLALVAALALLTVSGARAAWPERPVTLVVASPAGGPVDAVARLVGPGMAAAARAAGGGAERARRRAVGVERPVRSPPDGHTSALSGDAAVVVRTSMEPRPPYDPRRDLAPVSLLAAAPNLLVVAHDVPARDLQGLVALARARPGALGFAHTGPGTSQHIAGELLRQMAGIDIVGVSYNNPGAQVQDVLAGRVAMTFASAATALPRVRSGDWRALGVTSAERIAAAPEVPTVAEQGFPGFAAAAWFGLLAPAGTPPAVVERAHRPRWRRCARRICEPRLRSSASSPWAARPPSSPRTSSARSRAWPRCWRGPACGPGSRWVQRGRGGIADRLPGVARWDPDGVRRCRGRGAPARGERPLDRSAASPGVAVEPWSPGGLSPQPTMGAGSGNPAPGGKPSCRKLHHDRRSREVAMRILVMGAGAVGGYFGGRLAQAGARGGGLPGPARPQGAARPRRAGDREPERGRLARPGARGARGGGPAGLGRGAAGLQGLRPRRRDRGGPPGGGRAHGGAAAAQRLSHIEALEAAFGPGPRARRAGQDPGHAGAGGAVRHLAPFTALEFGELDGRMSERVLALQAAFARTPVQAEAAPDIRRRMWEKLAFLGALAAATVLMRANLGEIQRAPGGGAWLERLVGATRRSPPRTGHRCAPRRWSASSCPFSAARCPAARRHRLHMLRDLEAGGRSRPTTSSASCSTRHAAGPETLGSRGRRCPTVIWLATRRPTFSSPRPNTRGGPALRDGTPQGLARG
jgi:tripartite-type tricarboxylate transporter receptor subunit TctC